MKYIAILRGINVGGKRKILMKDLRLLFERMGFTEVKTYIQSGNVIFTSRKQNSKVEDELQQSILSTFGFEVPVIVRTIEELKKAIVQNPFFQDEDVEVERLHLTFLKEIPAPENREKTDQYDYSPDKFSIVEHHAFVYCSGKYHKSKLSNAFFENKLKTTATTRNWKTVLKLMELAK